MTSRTAPTSPNPNSRPPLNSTTTAPPSVASTLTLSSPPFGLLLLVLPTSTSTMRPPLAPCASVTEAPKAAERFWIAASRASLFAKRPKECEQCKQNTHHYDRDALPQQVYLKWMKFATNTKGQSLLAGRECYVCFHVRRRFYGQCDLDTLIDARAQSEVEDERFRSLRKDKASGETKLRKQGLTEAKLKVSKQDETFDEAFEEGTFAPLQTFAKQKSIDAEIYKNEEQLIRGIQKRWPSLEVGVGKSRLLGRLRHRPRRGRV